MFSECFGNVSCCVGKPLQGQETFAAILESQARAAYILYVKYISSRHELKFSDINLKKKTISRKHIQALRKIIFLKAKGPYTNHVAR